MLAHYSTLHPFLIVFNLFKGSLIVILLHILKKIIQLSVLQNTLWLWYLNVIHDLHDHGVGLHSDTPTSCTLLNLHPRQGVPSSGKQ